MDEESELRASKGGFLILISIKNFSDDSAKWTMTFNPIELEYFKILIRHIMNNPAKEITNIFALHRGNDLKSRQLGTLESQNILNKLRDYHWLRFSNEKPEIRLGPRFIAEMGPFLKLMFQNQTNDCLFCRKLVIQVCVTNILILNCSCMSQWARSPPNSKQSPTVGHFN